MKTVYFDIDTQMDFMTPAGALAVPGAERLIAGIAAMNQRAWTRGEVVVSTVDAHAENDAEFRVWPAHCVKGTMGQAKPEGTLHRGRVVVANEAGVGFEEDAAQYVVEKQALDCFTNVRLGALLEKLGAERYVVYGVVTEYCVRCAVMGLLGRGARVEMVVDGVMALSEEEGRKTVEEFVGAGGVLTTVGVVVG
jgi:nicotinamidase/pyrazinamidase